MPDPLISLLIAALAMAIGLLVFWPERGLFCFSDGRVALVGNEQIALLTPGEPALVVHEGEIPGKVGPVAAPDEEALYTVDRDLTRISWRNL